MIYVAIGILAFGILNVALYAWWLFFGQEIVDRVMDWFGL